MIQKIVIFTLIIVSYANLFAQISTQPIAHYKLDGNADDAINNNNGQIYGNISEVADRNGNVCGAMEFDGQSYIEIPNSRKLENITSEFTITGWIYYNSNCNNGLFWSTILCKGDQTPETDDNPQFRLQFTKVTFSIKSNMNGDKGCVSWADKSQYLSYDQWHFFACSYSGNEMKMYIDDYEILSEQFNQSLSKNNSPLHIGRDIPGNDEYFCGKLDDIKIYNKALSPNDISSIFRDVPQTICNSSNPPNPPNSTCNFPSQMNGKDIEYSTQIYTTNKDKIFMFGYDTIGDDDNIIINFNGRDMSYSTQLSDYKQTIFETILNQKCNYILIKSTTNDIAVMSAEIGRDFKEIFECTPDKYWGVKIIYQK